MQLFIWTPETFVSFNLGSLAEITEQGRNGGAISGDGDGRRRGESGGKGRGVHGAPNGGLGSPGGGRRRRFHGGAGTAEVRLAGGDVPVGERGSGWVGELQEGDGVPFQGLVQGVDGQSRELHGELDLAGANGRGGWGLGARGGLRSFYRR